jgi:periplasmic copper chaperone A
MYKMKFTIKSIAFQAMNTPAIGIFGIIFMALSGLFFNANALAQEGDAGQIRHVMMAQFDKPTDKLSVDPIVIKGDFAVAGWIQSGRGGRAVLVKEKGKWVINVCGGDGLKSAEALAQTGMPAATAQALAKDLATVEAKLSPDMLKKFAMFDGIVKVGAGHGAQAGHAAPAAHAGHATPVVSKSIEVKNAWVRTTVQGQKGTGAFMTITAKDALKLVGGSSPVAGVTEIHEMKMDGDIMRMRAVPGGLDLPAGKAVELKPGSYHVMLLDLKVALPKDTTVPVTLMFKDAKGAESKVELTVPVATTAPGGATMPANQHKH